MRLQVGAKVRDLDELAISANELGHIKVAADKAVQDALARAVGIRDHHALVAAMALVFERQVRRGARQVVAGEGLAPGLGGDDPVRAFPVEQQEQLQQGCLAPAIASCQDCAARQWKLHDPARAQGVDEHQAKQGKAFGMREIPVSGREQTAVGRHWGRQGWLGKRGGHGSVTFSDTWRVA